MADLIERQDAINVFGDVHPLDYNAQSYLDAIKALPSAQRKKGHWIHIGCGCFECDQCSELVSTNVYRTEKASDSFKFCPNCGADMRGEQDEQAT